MVVNGHRESLCICRGIYNAKYYGGGWMNSRLVKKYKNEDLENKNLNGGKKEENYIKKTGEIHLFG